MAKFNPEEFNKVGQSKRAGQVPPDKGETSSPQEYEEGQAAKRGGINYMVVVVTVIVVALALAALWVFVLDKPDTPPTATQTQSQPKTAEDPAPSETQSTDPTNLPTPEFDKNEITEGVRGNAQSYTNVDGAKEKSTEKSGEGCNVASISFECAKEGDVTADESTQVNMYLGYYMFQPTDTSSGEARVAAESKDGYRILITKNNAGVITYPKEGLEGERMKVVALIAPKDTYMHDDVKATLDGTSGKEGVFIPYGSSVVYAFDDTSKRIVEGEFPLS